MNVDTDSFLALSAISDAVNAISWRLMSRIPNASMIPKCAAGQPGAGRFFEATEKNNRKPAPRALLDKALRQGFAISHCDD